MGMKNTIALTVLFLFLLAAPRVNAQENYSSQSLEQWATSLDCAEGNQGVCAEAYLKFGLNSLMFSMTDSIAPVSTLATTNDPREIAQAYKRTALGQVTGWIDSMLTNPPASTTYFAYDFLQNAGFVEKAHAQGIGYSGLDPIIGLWKTFRNIAYVILVIVLVVIGFMIMFRMNINQQTVITVQNALPNIIISLLLITFSYAIAGLLIDLTYFLILLIVSLFYQAGGGANPSELATAQKEFLNAGAGMLFGRIVSGENIVALPAAIWGIFGPTLLAGGIVTGVFWGPAFAVGAIPAIALGIVTAALPLLIVIIALFFAFVRVFVILLMSYIQLLINIIFGPIFLLFGAIPGRATFSSWLRSLIGNLIVFPATAALILTANFISSAALEAGTSPLWLPPFLVGPPTAEADFPIAIIGLGFALMIPGMLKKIKGAVAPPPFVPFAPQAITAPAIEIMGRGFDVYHFFQARTQSKQLGELYSAQRRAGGGTAGEGQTEQLAEEAAKGGLKGLGS